MDSERERVDKGDRTDNGVVHETISACHRLNLYASHRRIRRFPLRYPIEEY